MNNKIIILYLFFILSGKIVAQQNINYSIKPIEKNKRSLQITVSTALSVNLGEFIVGTQSSVDFTYNEIIFNIVALDKEFHTVRLFNTNSNTGNEKDVKIITEWVVDNNIPFYNGMEFKFKENLIVKCKVKAVYVYSYINKNTTKYFDQELIVEEVY